ncbi:hypothetical protein [Brevibacillus laterosporus]|uniref:Uncharacterized protein n=1 Tax=Brevibacillus laterosporus TaxID=1465 RepID=A0AAP3DHE6_BRELA|nr:hypothetical protein [Brevibacillus laterosporus]MCR8980726.1 hypothetical protein [Brevibacillus laterosporus]MCZ0807881.1 hypothetical protein [Brevibacillus laterosporus]MCZ0826228.1 hypothetical protein [Brevibacillus laterosporus]MCZ0851239.1 hypothetical protein [Brevibacillus laterosporus]PPA93323.1 hypothetical protein C4A77_19140 [Brevibacillus laterosporus]
MKKTFLASAFSLATIMGTATTGLAASPIEVSSSASQAQSSVESKLQEQVIGNITVMSDYVKVGQDGLVHVDPAAKEIVGKEVYEVYVNGAASVNSAIESGDIKVKDGELSVDKKDLSAPTEKDSKVASLGSFGNYYWWGYAFTMTDRDTRDVANAWAQAGTVTAGVTAISGLIPSPPTKLVQAISYALSTGMVAIANEINHKNEGYGVTINIHYVGYFTISTNPKGTW